MAKKYLLKNYYDALGISKAPDQTKTEDTSQKESDELAAYQKAASEQTNPIDSQTQTQPTSATPTTAARPQSWNGLKSFLTQYIDANRNWDNENINDYSILNNAIAAKQLTNDQRAEGQILFQNYLSDVTAQNTYNKAISQAENQARKNTANNTLLADRIMSYLKEVQGNAGFDGYDGVTKGQAISLANMQASAQQEVQAQRANAQQSALEAYQNAMLDNSKNFSDQYGTLMAARDEKADTNYQNYVVELQNYVEAAKNDDGKVSKSDYNKALNYIQGLDTTTETKKRLEDYLDLAYEKSIISDEESAAKERQAKLAEINALTINDFDTYISGLSEEQKKAYKTELDKKESEIYPKGRSEVVTTGKYDAGSTRLYFSYEGKDYYVHETIGDNPLGSDTGTFTEDEAKKWGIELPSKHTYNDILAVKKDGVTYFYRKRNGKWYYVAADNWSEKARLGK